MGKIDFHVAHTLSLAEAKKRIEKLTQHWAKHGIQSTWSGDTAQLPHTNACSAAGPCVVYLTAPKGFDLTFVK